MKTSCFFSVVFLSLSLLDASSIKNNAETDKEETCADYTEVFGAKRPLTIDPVGDSHAAQRLRLSSSSNTTAPLILSAPLKMIYYHALAVISARSPADTAVELSINIDDEYSSDQSINTRLFIEHVMEEISRRRQIFVFNHEKYLWNIHANANPAEVKLLGFLAGLALKHKIPLTIKFEQIFYQAMTGNMSVKALKDVMSFVDPFMLSCLNDLRDYYDEIVTEDEFSFKEFGLADEPVTYDKIDRYINLKIKSYLYYSRDHLLTAFLQGVRLITHPSEINREYDHRSISAILAPKQDIPNDL